MLKSNYTPTENVCREKYLLEQNKRLAELIQEACEELATEDTVAAAQYLERLEMINNG